MMQRKIYGMPMLFLFVLVLGFGACSKNNPPDPEPPKPEPVDTTKTPDPEFSMNVKLYSSDYPEFWTVSNRSKSSDLNIGDTAKYFQSTISQFQPLTIAIKADTMLLTKPGNFKVKYSITIKEDKIYLLDTVSKKTSFFAYKVSDKELKLPIGFYKKTLSMAGKKVNSIGQDYGLEEYLAVMPESLPKMDMVWLKVVSIYK